MRPLDGYPTSWGSSRASVFPHAGPTLYQRVNLGSPSTVPVSDGDTVEAVEAGMKYFDIVLGSLTDSSLYEVQSIPVAQSDEMSGAQTTTYKLRWVVVATGAEVADGVDLSAEIVRLLAVGPK